MTPSLPDLPVFKLIAMHSFMWITILGLLISLAGQEKLSQIPVTYDFNCKTMANRFLNISKYLISRHLQIKKSPGDGHCLLHSICSSWHSQLPSKIHVTIESLKSGVFIETVLHADQYKPFLQLHSSSLYTGLRSYILDRHYNQGFGDLVPSVISNALNTRLIILDEGPQKSFGEIIVSPRTEPSNTITIHRQGDHYNGIIKYNLDPPPVQSVSHRIQYNADFLKSLRDKGNKLKRCTRKALFNHRLWKPQNQHSPFQH